MLKYEKIVKKIFNCNEKLSESDITLIAKYFNSLFELNIVTSVDILDKLVDKVVNELEGIVYYDNNDEELLNKLGISKNNKGLSKNNIIYVNKNMSDEMVKITLLHELTHFLQRYHIDGLEECIGVMKNFKWRILMEAQTQNLAEIVYSHNYGNKKDITEYKSEEVRMLPGGIVKSNLRNYQMYDYLLKKICLVLNMSIEEFIGINFYMEQASKIFEDKVDKMYGEEVTVFLSELLDVIYSTDAIIYTGNVEDLSDPYIVPSLIDGREINVSSKNQFKCMKQFDSFLLYLSKQKIDVYSKLLDFQFDIREEYLPKSSDFSEVSQTSQEEVENNPEKYIMTECLPACKELWDKNIYTFMVSNYLEEHRIWIEIYAEISEENLNYLKSLKDKNINVCVYHEGCYQIIINHVGQKASDLLLEICKGFKIQDVPEGIAYYTEENFLVKCGCYDEIINPNYYEMKEIYEMEFNSLEEQRNYIVKYRKWESSEISKKFLKQYNPTKKEKSTEEYAKEHNLIYADGRVYRTKFDYDKHLKYLQYIETNIVAQEYATHFENGVESVEHKL